MTLEANPDYTWGPKPTVKTFTIQYAPDPTAAVQSLANGELQIINPQATEDVLKGLAAAKDQGIETINGNASLYEHVDLVFTNGGPFDPKSYGGDAAKALAVRTAFLKAMIPRQDIVDRLYQAAEPGRPGPQLVQRAPGSPSYDAVTAANGMKEAHNGDVAARQEDPDRRRHRHLDPDQGAVHVRGQQPAAGQRVPAHRGGRQGGRVRRHRRQERRLELAAGQHQALRRLDVRAGRRPPPAPARSRRTSSARSTASGPRRTTTVSTTTRTSTSG